MLDITVRGRWTARRVPRWAARLWLAWVFFHVVRRVENGLLVYRVWRADGVGGATVPAASVEA